MRVPVIILKKMRDPLLLVWHSGHLTLCFLLINLKFLPDLTLAIRESKAVLGVSLDHACRNGAEYTVDPPGK